MPLMHDDLTEGNIVTSNKYHVEWKHVAMVNQALTTDLDHYLLKAMCV